MLSSVSPGPLEQVTAPVYCVTSYIQKLDTLPLIFRAQTFWAASTEQQNSQLIDSRAHSLINAAVINKPLFIYKYTLVKISSILSKQKSH